MSTQPSFAFILTTICLAVIVLFCPAIIAQGTKPKVQKQTAQLYVQMGHYNRAELVVVSPDGKTVASTDRSNITLWETSTGRELGILPQSVRQGPASLTFSPDGKTIASIDNNSESIILWDITTREKSREFEGKVGGGPVAFSPDNKMIALYSKTSVKLWSLESGKEIKTLPNIFSLGIKTNLAFSPDSKTLALVNIDNEDYELQLWNIAIGKKVRTFPMNDTSSLITFSPDGKTLAVSDDTATKLLKVTTGQVLRIYEDIKAFYGLTFTSDSKMMLVIGSYGRLYMRDVATDQKLEKKEQLISNSCKHSSSGTSKDGRTIALACDDGTIKLWDLVLEKEIQTFKGYAKSVASLALSPDGKTIALGRDDSLISLWNLATGELRNFAGHALKVGSIAFSPDGKTIASEEESGVIKLWNALTGQEIRTIRKVTENLTSNLSVVFSRDGKLVASLKTEDEDGNFIKLWDVATGQEAEGLAGVKEHDLLSDLRDNSYFSEKPPTPRVFYRRELDVKPLVIALKK